MAEPWYEGGLRFTCTACGTCCSGEPGAVWVNDDEIAALAAHLGTTPADVEATYVRRLGSRRALFERFDGDCIFLDEGSRRCTVYAARPVQCQTFPFWKETVKTAEAWDEVTRACPGAGSGKLHTVDEIRARVRRSEAARRA
jgi:Fe-S-cluster containining protein